ncbi:MAG: hypothetical protein ABIA37_00220 [Candidatus Woesearchaeota archaeon]
MALGKKGVFFTFVALTFLTLLIVSASVLNTYEMREKSFAIETKVNSMDNFIVDVEEDIQRAAYISGFRSFVSMYEYTLTKGEYIDDVDSAFDELFLEGTLNGNVSTLLINNTFTNWTTEIQEQAAEIGINITFVINDITVSQDDPWKIRIDLDLTLQIQDFQGVASWSKPEQLTSYVEIEGFGDPIYIIETNGLVENKIRPSPFTTFVSGTDVTNLLNHTYEGYYINDGDAPNYLQRLEGNVKTGSAQGIESLVDLAEFSSKGVPTQDKSIVDHLYFEDKKNEGNHILGTPAWFKIDNNHKHLYQVDYIVG